MMSIISETWNHQRRYSPDVIQQIAREQGLKRAGSEYKGPCPICGGRDRFHIKQGKSSLLLHCRNGCSYRDLAGTVGLEQERPLLPRRVEIAAEIPAPISETRPKALEFWRKADNDDAVVASHPYAKRKQITHAFGARRGVAGGSVVGYDSDCILVPNRSWDGEFLGVECINAEGKKQTFGNKGILMLGNPEDAMLIHLCEGWATAWALSQMFPQRFAVIVCFGKQIQRAIPEASKRYAGRLVIHEESATNRDAWDVWHAGDGETYTKNIVEALS